MCIFYQDELACCCLNGFTWDFEKHVKCIEDRYDIDEPPVCPDKITVKDTKDMKLKLETIKTILSEERLYGEYGTIIRLNEVMK